MQRVVLDTNVLVSALITPRGASARLLVELRAGAFELIVSPQLLDELRDVLWRPKFRRYATEAEVEAYVDLTRREAMLFDDVEPPTSGPSPIDPDDRFPVDLARMAGAHTLVSGDAHLLELRPVVPVMTPGEFLETLDD